MRKLIGAALALTLLGGTAAVAQPNGYGRNDGGVYDNRGGVYDNRGYDQNFNDRDGRGWGQLGINWRRGMVFRQHARFVVRDWFRHGLQRPPRGMHWSQSGNVFLLVNTRGMVVDVVFRPRVGNGIGYGRGGFDNRF